MNTRIPSSRSPRYVNASPGLPMICSPFIVWGCSIHASSSFSKRSTVYD